METALFSPASLFDGPECDSSSGSDAESFFVERDHVFPGMVLKIREFGFHQVNANLLWPGTCEFAKWLTKHPTLLYGRRILELGSGTGALTIFLKKSSNFDITTSDYNDEDIEKNICYNCLANDVPISPHILHTWGDKFPCENPHWDLIIASDILLYVKQYSNLIKTLSCLLFTWKPKEEKTETPSPTVFIEGQKFAQVDENIPLKVKEDSHTDGRKNWIDIPSSLPKPCFLMSWRRRIPKDDEDLFFNGCKTVGLCVTDYGSRVYCIHPTNTN